MIVDEIATQCIELISKLKQVPAESIHLDSTFEELVIDSLDKVSLAFDVEDLFKIEIPESRLITIRSVQDMVNGIEEAVRSRTLRETQTTPSPTENA
jgi:acyl carrier protein